MTQEEITRKFPNTVFPTFSEKEINEKIKEVKTITANIDDKKIIIPMQEEKDMLEKNRLLNLYSQYLLHSDKYKTNLKEVKEGDILYCVNDAYMEKNKFFEVESFIDINREYKEAINKLSDKEKQTYYNLEYSQEKFDEYINKNVHSKEEANTRFYLYSIEIENLKINRLKPIFSLINTQMLKLEKINSFFAEIRLFAEKNNIQI